MRTFLEIALSCIQRGWYVFPCAPAQKTPLVRNGFKDASNAEDQIRVWATVYPKANVGIATGASGLTVLDVDKGLTSGDDLRLFMAAKGLPETYTVRTGRRDGFGAQMYFVTGTSLMAPLKSIAWIDEEDPSVSGDIRGGTGYVMAAGSIHPDSGEKYEVLVDAPVATTPDYVRSLKAAPKTGAPGNPNAPVVDDGGPISDHRNVHMISLLGAKRNEGYDDDRLREYAETVNEERMQPPLSESELEKLIGNACKFALPETVPAEILIGGKAAPEPSAPVDWRSHYHTSEEMENAPELTFLIDGFMHVESITGLAAPAGQRKSLIALNVAHALCTGEPLFGHFAVTQKPTRVLYLCPEMGMRSFRKRARSIGLMPYVGKTFFCRTMNIEDVGDPLGLDDLQPGELDGAVVIVDTAIRFIKGDESKSQDMREFAKTLYRLIPHGGEPGAAAVLVLYHSGKAVVKESNELTLENVLRGSSELGAALTCCYGTKLQEQEDPTASVFKAISYIKCVKPRDFEDEPKAFETTCDETCKMTYLPNEGVPLLKVRSQGNRGNKDGKDDAAIALIAANQTTPGTKLAALLAEHDIKRSPSWVNLRKAELAGTGTKRNSG